MSDESVCMLAAPLTDMRKPVAFRIGSTLCTWAVPLCCTLKFSLIVSVRKIMFALRAQCGRGHPLPVMSRALHLKIDHYLLTSIADRDNDAGVDSLSSLLIDSYGD